MDKITGDHGKKVYAGKGGHAELGRSVLKQKGPRGPAFIETRIQSCSPQTRVRDPRRRQKKVEGVLAHKKISRVQANAHERESARLIS